MGNFKSEKRNKQIVEQLLEKHVQEHIYRRLSARERTESEKVSNRLALNPIFTGIFAILHDIYTVSAIFLF